MWRSASIRTNSLRNCLVNLSGDLAQFFTKRVENSFAPVVLALEFAESKRGIYVSWSGETVVDRSQGFESVVEIGKRFASCLGLKEQEQIIVRKVESVSSCTRAFLDPGTPDDWEILQIHASYVESHLLDQVRIVFPGQELPVWINKNTYILIRIGMIEPEAVCARLEEFTEVAIAPNIRNKQSTALSNKQSKTADNLMGGNKQSLDQEEISIHEEPESISSKLYSFVSSLLARRAEETIETPSTKHHGGTVCEGSRTLSKSCCQTSFEHSKIDLCFRVQPLISGQTFSEPSTVFVCSDSFCHKTQLYCKKCNKRFGESDIFHITKLQKLACPKELNARSKGGPVTAERKDRASQQEITTDTNMVNQDSDLNKNEKDNLVSPQSSIIARLTVTVSPFVGSCIDKHHATKVLPGHILVPEGLCKQLGLTPMSLVRLMSHAFEPTELKGLIVQPCKESLEKFPDVSDKKILSAFHKWVDGIQNKSVVITNGMVMSFPIYCNDEVLECLLTVLSHCDTKDPNMYCYLTRQTTEKVSVVVGKPVAPMAYDLQQLHKEKMCQVPTSLFKNTIDDLGGINDRYAKCMEHLLISFGQRPVAKELGEIILFGLRNGTLLICGATGSGKTCLAHAVCHQLHQWPVCAHVSIVPCIPLRGKKVETIQKQLRQVFREAAWHQPAVILLDDLDQVISAPSSNQELGGEALYRRRLAEVFKDLVRTEVASGDKVAVIATSRSRETLHPVLVSYRGLHIFQCCVEIAPPDCDQRKEILMSIMKRKIDGSCRLDLSALARKTEGFSSKDLTSLVDRLVHQIALRQTPQGGISCLITEEDFVTTLKGFKPAALRGVSLHSSGDLGWCDVGGLSDVKSALKETLQWPTKYASLFSKCPLRLRSGLLLYGPPGTGKTLMAGVVAKECGLNFISIKGPELLSKYIGASEQAVRDMFIRAQSAKPCILFFDEFDSLAPKRGHDSTGVTDRVVNQLLTQLDGVEGLQGVYILGATSRPDLIDTALLRPGRLDKCLYCGIPNNDERVEILQALSRIIPLAQDVDLKAVAGMCEEFTGADIKALLYNAQLEAIHRTVGKVHLYGDVLGNSTPSSTLERGCDATENVSNCNGDETCFQVQWPSEREGKLGSTGDEERQIAQQVTAIQESYLRNLKQEPSQKKSSAAVTILQSDLMKTAQSMVPSVSESERRRYNEIYTSFIASRSKTFTQSQMPSHGKATLA